MNLSRYYEIRDGKIIVPFIFYDNEGEILVEAIIDWYA